MQPFKLNVAFHHFSGEITARDDLDPAEALAALKDMLDEIDSLQAGDVIVVTENGVDD